MKTIRITHPQAGESRVPASAVPHWRSSGWTPVDEAPQAEQATEAPAGSAPATEETPSRRRANKESE